MDEDGAVQAVYSTIKTNKDSLVSDLTQNSLPRELEWLADTFVDVPNAYYAVAVHCELADEHGHPEVTNTNMATPYQTTYQMIIRLGDAALFEPGEDVFGSTAHTNFRDFCDNVVKLFRRDQEWFPSASASPRFRLHIDSRRGRAIRKENDIPLPIEDGVALLSATIRFTLSGCDD